MKPRVSIVIPCYNEAHTIGALLDALREQTVPVAEFEVVIADGGSDDGTRQLIKDYKEVHPDLMLKLVDNPDRIIPAALNRAISAAEGEFVVRLDAHSIPYPDYIERCVEILSVSGFANVGGVWQIEPGADTWIARGIAAAAAHPLGAGGARYRKGGLAGPVETVPFGAFKKTWLDRVGTFDESLLTNEDYEYNLRLRKAGGEVYFDPKIRSIYIARATLKELARQYLRYGYWKARMLKRHPSSILLRQLLPPVFVFSIILLTGFAYFNSYARLLLAVELGVYVLTTLSAGALEAIRKSDCRFLFSTPIALVVMHFSWGAGFLWSAVCMLIGRRHET
jgi:glycosyltransferase involved in cell wall biosynthesis